MLRAMPFDGRRLFRALFLEGGEESRNRLGHLQPKLRLHGFVLGVHHIRCYCCHCAPSPTVGCHAAAADAAAAPIDATQYTGFPLLPPPDQGDFFSVLRGRADRADQVVWMRWPHGEPPGRKPADQQQPLSPYAYQLVFGLAGDRPSRGGSNFYSLCLSDRLLKPKPSRAAHSFFAFSAPRPGFAGFPLTVFLVVSV